MTMTNSSRTVGARLRAARALSGLDQREIAETLGIPRSSISAWENGHTEPLAGSFIRLAQLTGVSLEWLAFGVGPIEPAVVRPEGFEPPTFWLGVSGRSQACADGDHLDCLGACTCWCHDDVALGALQLLEVAA